MSAEILTLQEAVAELSGLIRSKLREHSPLFVAIDGRCASGKTTLAAALAKELGCTLIHMDDFFLRPEQRTPERFAEPGGNVDYERFLSDVLKKLCEGLPFSYAPFDCHTLAMAQPIPVTPGEVTLIEGSYSCHPKLRDYYALRIFLTVRSDTQLERIEMREGKEAASRFRERWIPLEERYFSSCAVENCCGKTIELK